MTRSFYINENRRTHLLRHMQSNELAGSHFYPHVFGAPQALIDYINSHEPMKVIQQRNKRFAFCFAEMDGHLVGTSGLAKRIDLQASQIQPHVREGFTIEVGIVDTLPETHLFSVITDETPDGLSIITAFPGEFARPFAQKSQPREEYELNKKFWQEHVLLKQKNTKQ
jgi:hypothetical protein